jgi:hypothetical protein
VDVRFPHRTNWPMESSRCRFTALRRRSGDAYGGLATRSLSYALVFVERLPRDPLRVELLRAFRPRKAC